MLNFNGVEYRICVSWGGRGKLPKEVKDYAEFITESAQHVFEGDNESHSYVEFSFPPDKREEAEDCYNALKDHKRPK
jgi:hypothetical protein